MSDYVTLVTYPGDGATQLYAIPFPYIKREDVKVTRSQGDSAFTFASDGAIRLNTPLLVGQTVTIERLTDTSEMNAVFGGYKGVTAEQLNSNFKQTLYAVDETRQSLKNYARHDGVSFDMKNVRVSNVAAPVEADDAATMGYVDTVVEAAVDALEEAVATRTPIIRTHSTDQINGLTTALSGKPDIGHVHTAANVTSLDTALSGKAVMTLTTYLTRS